MSLIKNKKVVAVGLSIVVSIFMLVLVSTQALMSWQLRLSDLLQFETNPSEEIVIVMVDDNTLDGVFGLGPVQTWSRSNYAQVLNNLNKYEPKVVAFDVLFKDLRDPEGDQMFAESLSKTKAPVLRYRMIPLKDVDENLIVSDSKNKSLPPHETFRSIENVILASTESIPDYDGVIRKYIPGILEKDTYFESFAVAVARIFLDLDSSVDIPKNPDLYDLSPDFQVPLDDRQMVINYSTNFDLSVSRANTYAKVPFVDVYDDKYDYFNPELFKDKIVLIGAHSEELKDTFLTPVDSNREMYGVEIHANAIQTILDRKFLRYMSFLEQILLVLLIVLVSSFVFLYTRIRWSLLYLAAVPATYTFAAQPLFNAGIVIDLVHPYLALVTIFVASYMYRYLTEFREKNELKGAFAKYVNPTIVDQIMKNPEKLKLGGEKRTVTVLFTDIANFTSISEKLKPESLVALLNEYLEAMSNVIMGEGGTLDKYEGDAIMAFFGAPIDQSDHALRACKAILKMRQKLEELHENWKKDPLLPGGETRPVIDFRCGLSSGEVIVGNIGSSNKLEYTVIGDIVNLGSRLEGANKKYSTNVMMSEDTYTQVKTEFEARELDIIKVVGKTEPIKVYELLNFKGQLVPEAAKLLTLYNEGLQLYHDRKFADALVKFDEILKVYPEDGPSKLYRQRCEVLKDFPPKDDWDGVFEMISK